MIQRPPRSTLDRSSAASDVYKRQGVNNYVFFTPEDGMKIIVTGRVTVYPPRGSYQIDVRSMKPAGVGELQAAFERLKKKLFEEGLFDQENKKEIPTFPKKIGLITAAEAVSYTHLTLTTSDLG